MKLSTLDKKEVENTTYLKLVQNKTHFGPVSEAKVARAKAKALSAAANKVRVAADFTIQINKDQDSNSENRSNARSYVFEDIGDTPIDVTKSAVYLMQAWDHQYGDEGTPDYVNKLAKALEARAAAYNKLGINPNSSSKPNLTSDQRVIYNSIVGPTGFDYYEYHLAFKIEGQKKFVRSKTYRSLRPLDIKSMLSSLGKDMRKLQEEITLTARQSN
jgi:osmotically-inducible protein OsmY